MRSGENQALTETEISMFLSQMNELRKCIAARQAERGQRDPPRAWTSFFIGYETVRTKLAVIVWVDGHRKIDARR